MWRPLTWPFIPVYGLDLPAPALHIVIGWLQWSFSLATEKTTAAHVRADDVHQPRSTCPSYLSTKKAFYQRRFRKASVTHEEQKCPTERDLGQINGNTGLSPMTPVSVHFNPNQDKHLHQCWYCDETDWNCREHMCFFMFESPYTLYIITSPYTASTS